MRDIAFESEEFNRSFEVRCDDDRFANAVLDAQMIAWLLDLEGQRGFESMDGMLLGYTPIESLPDPQEGLQTGAWVSRARPIRRVQPLPGEPLPAAAPPPAR